ncbi:hypothetical protein MBLNU457_6656t1 [Dothideomycetes sp. NU457]
MQPISVQPQIPVLAQSENKSKFLERLGLDDESEGSKNVYSMMKEEAVAGRARITEDSNSLQPEFKNDPNVRPPYSVTQISDAAMHRETLYIYRHARPETKAQYDRGHYIEGGKEENWIIKWSLWHVFRYRDNRNRGRTTPGTSHRGSLSSSNSTGGVAGNVEQSPTVSAAVAARERQDSAHAHYDPVRDVYRRP